MICYLWARYDICSACQKVEMSLVCHGGRQGEWRSAALSFIPFCPSVSLALSSSVLLPAGIFLLHSQVTLSVAVSERVFPVALSCCIVCACAIVIGMIMVLGMPFRLIYIIFTSRKEIYSVRIFCSLMIKQYLCNRF